MGSGTADTVTAGGRARAGLRVERSGCSCGEHGDSGANVGYRILNFPSGQWRERAVDQCFEGQQFPGDPSEVGANVPRERRLDVNTGASGDPAVAFRVIGFVKETVPQVREVRCCRVELPAGTRTVNDITVDDRALPHLTALRTYHQHKGTPGHGTALSGSDKHVAGWLNEARTAHGLPFGMGKQLPAATGLKGIASYIQLAINFIGGTRLGKTVYST